MSARGPPEPAATVGVPVKPGPGQLEQGPHVELDGLDGETAGSRTLVEPEMLLARDPTGGPHQTHRGRPQGPNLQRECATPTERRRPFAQQPERVLVASGQESAAALTPPPDRLGTPDRSGSRHASLRGAARSCDYLGSRGSPRTPTILGSGNEPFARIRRVEADHAEVGEHQAGQSSEDRPHLVPETPSRGPHAPPAPGSEQKPQQGDEKEKHAGQERRGRRHLHQHTRARHHVEIDAQPEAACRPAPPGRRRRSSRTGRPTRA
jgi:hypothetical protein